MVNERRSLHSKKLRPEENQWQLRHQIVDRAQAVLIAQMMTLTPPILENLISCRKTLLVKLTVSGECSATPALSCGIAITLRHQRPRQEINLVIDTINSFSSAANLVVEVTYLSLSLI